MEGESWLVSYQSGTVDKVGKNHWTRGCHQEKNRGCVTRTTLENTHCSVGKEAIAKDCGAAALV